MLLVLELAFAIAPLVISATEHYQKTYRKLKMVMSSKADEELEDFLAELHDEISLLSHTLRCLISDLTTLTEDERERLLRFDREQWAENTVSAALKMRLGGEEEVAFIDILSRLLKSLEEVVSEKSLKFVKSDLNSSPHLFKKLEGFRENMKKGAKIQDLCSRFQFTAKEERRKKNIKKIAKCNIKLERLVHGNPTGITLGAKKISRRKAQPPTNRSRRLSQAAYGKIAGNWSCNCPSPHEARLGLLKCLISPENAGSAINLDLLISMETADQAEEIWLESKIHILDKEEPKNQAAVRFTEDSVQQAKPPPKGRCIDTESVCTLIKEAHKNNHNLHLVFDGDKLWQVKSSGSHIILRPEIGIPLKTLLGESETRLKLKESRALAVVLAHAILHYCESGWFSKTWNKEYVNFFATANGPDLMKPYLATQFEPLGTIEEETSDNMYSHPNSALLSLGILLLELYTSRAIESYWDPDDTEDGMEGANTNWITAEKLLETIGDDVYEGYRNAIQACLNIDYAGHENNSSLNDETFRKMVYERVVIPLEDELENGFRITPQDLGVL